MSTRHFRNRLAGQKAALAALQRMDALGLGDRRWLYHAQRVVKSEIRRTRYAAVMEALRDAEVVDVR